MESAFTQAVEKAIDAEQARWQEGIDALIYSRYPDRDGSGCDSGDPLDLTMAELHGMVNHIDEQHTTEVKQLVDGIRLAMSWIPGYQRNGWAPEMEDVKAKLLAMVERAEKR